MSLAPSAWDVGRSARWLCVLAGLSFMAAANPAFAASNKDDLVIVPNSSVTGLRPPSATPSSGTGVLTLVGVILLGGAGGWMLLRARAGGLKQFNRAPRNLAVEETRSLGNRQYLVVATYQDKKFLIGVCPGRIDLLSTLPPSSAVQSELGR